MKRKDNDRKVHKAKRQKPSSKPLKKLVSYKVPQSIYDKAVNDLKNRTNALKFEQLARQKCHNVQMYKYFNTTETPRCKQNFMEAAKQAFEGRNFLVLYDLISKALEVRDTYLQQQVYEVMYTAILTDRSITNKQEAIEKFALRVLLVRENEVDTVMSQNHVLIDDTRKEENDEEIAEII